ncbi:hypothetical protein PV325_010768 [Microctonus aethiopoides]|uniref:Tctex1 domain-containing protein 2 n=1 Tax=Microctonus aethiopoides TaxID=144406 RepID=A0AA39F786_9HYME|nr:hypothetical protein PV325_010768 [Microctonus aethiopoides]KAK0164149.1 hypothetical protein PV328_002810 [Microctonus aethiopoides]
MTTIQMSQSESNDLKINENSDVNIELLDENDLEYQAAYQIRPKLSEKFKPQIVKEMIHNILFDQLSSQKYNVDEAKVWSKKIADTIRDKVKELNFQRYKFVINVVLGEQRGAGVKTATRCLWDAEADNYAHGHFVNV